MNPNYNKLFRPAVRDGRRVRIGLYGPGASGKTTLALMLGEALAPVTATVGHQIQGQCVLDTEGEAAALYADRFAFTLANPNAFAGEVKGQFQVDNDPRYLAVALREASARFPIVVMDTMSAAWKCRMEMVDLAEQKNPTGKWGYHRNAWNTLLSTALGCPSHVLAVFRDFTKWGVGADNVPTKLWYGPEGPDDMINEFDAFLQVGRDHRVAIVKSRLGQLQGQVYAADEWDKLCSDVATVIAAAPPPTAELVAICRQRVPGAAEAADGEILAWVDYLAETLGEPGTERMTYAQLRQASSFAAAVHTRKDGPTPFAAWLELRDAPHSNGPADVTAPAAGGEQEAS